MNKTPGKIFRALPAGIGLGGAAVALLWIRMSLGRPNGTVLAVLVGVLLVLAVVFLSAAAVRWRRDRLPDLSRYRCPRCNYQPTGRDVTHGASYPCPTCGETIYTRT